jgi:hypothetical protein
VAAIDWSLVVTIASLCVALGLGIWNRVSARNERRARERIEAMIDRPEIVVGIDRPNSNAGGVRVIVENKGPTIAKVLAVGARIGSWRGLAVAAYDSSLPAILAAGEQLRTEVYFTDEARAEVPPVGAGWAARSGTPLPTPPEWASGLMDSMSVVLASHAWAQFEDKRGDTYEVESN